MIGGKGKLLYFTTIFTLSEYMGKLNFILLYFFYQKNKCNGNCIHWRGTFTFQADCNILL